MTATVTRARTDALEAVAQSFKGAMAAVRRLRGREAHRSGELSHAQYSLLFGLAHGERMSSRELAHAADLSPATATEMLDALAAAGLVERIRSDTDKRIVFTSLTPRGKALVEERRAQFEPRWQAALAGFSEAELLAAAAVLGELRGLFDELAGSED